MFTLSSQHASKEVRTGPLKMSPLPSKPWSEISVDFASPDPSVDYIVVILDEYSRFPVAEAIHSTAASTVIPHLDRTFAIPGIPDQIKMNNGPPFNEQDFGEFTKHMGYKHGRITVLPCGHEPMPKSRDARGSLARPSKQLPLKLNPGNRPYQATQITIGQRLTQLQVPSLLSPCLADQ